MSLTAEDIRNCTMIALDQPPWWPEEADDDFKFTVRIPGTALNYVGPNIYIITPFSINWGDGVEEDQESHTGSIRHTYNSAGDYQITIKTDGKYGSFRSCYFTPYGVTPVGTNTTLISIDSPIPRAALYSYYSSTEGGTILVYNNAFYFAGCINLESIPHDLFAKVRNIWNWPKIINPETGEIIGPCTNYYGGDARRQFSECHSLIRIPNGLYKESGSNSFEYTFSGLSAITEIPSDLFENASRATTYSRCFLSCASLESIPEGLFDDATTATTFAYCFASCTSLTEIPEGLFDHTLNVTSFLGCFSYCASLTEIPEGLFDYTVSVTNFSYCFSHCTVLQEIPEGLFDYTVSVTNFSYCFEYCKGFTTIPNGLFDYTVNATTFAGCFQSTKIIEIPRGLFNNTSRVTTFSSCFYGTYITEIPNGLFDYVPNVTNFQNCFSYCDGLEYIPSGLFRYTNVVTNFDACFWGCTELTDIPYNLFNSITTNPTFRNSFRDCSGIVTSVPALWNLFNAAHSACFRGCTNASNYEDIPSDWK